MNIEDKLKELGIVLNEIPKPLGSYKPAVVSGKPSESLLIDAINYGDFEMPPKTKLPAGEIAILTKWVEMGAPW